jgi:hypothetical protein
MKKMLFVIAVMMFVLFGCTDTTENYGNDSNNNKDTAGNVALSLLGTWETTGTELIIFTFNGDRTGSAYNSFALEEDTTYFNWDVSNNVVCFDGEHFRNHCTLFGVLGNTLVIWGIQFTRNGE